jgi:hypothetical protein
MVLTPLVSSWNTFIRCWKVKKYLPNEILTILRYHFYIWDIIQKNYQINVCDFLFISLVSKVSGASEFTPGYLWIPRWSFWSIRVHPCLFVDSVLMFPEHPSSPLVICGFHVKVSGASEFTHSYLWIPCWSFRSIRVHPWLFVGSVLKFPEHPSSPLVICGFRVDQSLVFCAVFSRSLFLFSLSFSVLLRLTT